MCDLYVYPHTTHTAEASRGAAATSGQRERELKEVIIARKREERRLAREVLP